MIDVMDTLLELRNVEYEKAILSASMNDATCLLHVLSRMYPEHFWDARHSTIMWALTEAAKASTPDMLILRKVLRDNEKIEEVGGFSYLMAVASTTYHSENLGEYMDSVIDLAARRKFLMSLGKIQSDVLDKSRSYTEIMSAFVMSSLSSSPSGSHTAKRIGEFSDTIDRVISGDFKATNVTGYKQLDMMTRGIPQKELVILAARPSVGKTALALDIALHQAIMGIPVEYFSLEMSAETLYLRLISHLAQLDGIMIAEGVFSEAELSRIKKAKEYLDVLPLYINDDATLTSKDIELHVKTDQKKYGIRTVIIDYLTLLKDKLQKGQLRAQLIGEMCKNLRGMGKELGIGVLALTQLLREADGVEPKLSHLRESGDIEQDADQVWFLWPDTETPALINVGVAKQRNGPTGKLQLAFIKKYSRFAELSGKPSSPPSPPSSEDESTSKTA